MRILAVVSARSDFKSHRIKLTVRTDNRLKLKANKEALREVINNLIVNSIQSFQNKASPEYLNDKTPEIAVSAKRQNDHIQIIVSDNGAGIPKQFVSRIFDPFFTTKATGTGLGLAQVHKIIRDHNGDVDVESEEGKGTTLKIRLPA